MTLTRRQKYLAAVMSLGLLAVVVDQVLISGPAPLEGAAATSAEEYVVSGDNRGGTETTPSQAPDLPAPAAVSPVVERIARERGVNPLRAADAFATPVHWFPEPELPAVAEDTGPGFAEGHQLEAVMMNDAGGAAIINGRLLRVGETIGGYRLIEVRDQSALLRDEHDDVVVLRLPTSRR